ncbi:hypothetical protein BKA62DRAFT_801954 [Auriculariales sp. MPI-PUGE-AT-0066]|nr:hypothetical protein BKA62DRAFT_801954 [Auriculariales sp. MPI-PUGE-AT-0066]
MRTGMASDLYVGEEKIVFGFDIGTTQTAVAFVHLQDTMTPQVKSVTQWPGQEDLPTVVHYDAYGQALSYGASALENATDDESLAKWFKLHLHPSTMRTSTGAGLEIPPLPFGVTKKQVYTDFLKYIYAHAISFFIDHSPDGKIIWDRVKSKVEIVLAIPNGWDLAQHSFLRDVIVLAKVLPQGHDPKRLMFVSEAEASVHYALHYTNGERWLKPGMKFCVLDAGGSTVDTTLYECSAVTPKLELKEVTSSDCVQAGGVFVNRDAEKLLRLKFRGSQFSKDENIKEMMAIFESKTKRKYDGSSDPSVITFGRKTDNDPDYGINKGKFSLTSAEVATTFQNVIKDISESFQSILERANNDCQSFSWSEVLQEKNSAKGINTISIDDGSKKAAAEGAVIWYTRQTVVARASRAHFGTDTTVAYNSELREHRQRQGQSRLDINGVQRINWHFHVWCKKNEIIRDTEPRRFAYTQRWSMLLDINEALKEPYKLHVFACDNTEAQYWLKDTGEEDLMPGMRRVCTIVADLSNLRGSLKPITSSTTGMRYYEMPILVNIYFGQTALSAEICWVEGDELRKSQLQLIPDSLL